MPNQSFLSWQGVLRCDGPEHKGHDEHRPDWIYDAAHTVSEYKDAARRDGWQFKRDGRVICPACAKRQ